MSDIKNIHVINSLGRISDLRGWSENFVQLDCFSWRRTRIINLPSNQKGYDNSETTVGKLLARIIQIFPGNFCLGNILEVILNNFQNNAQTKIALS